MISGKRTVTRVPFSSSDSAATVPFSAEVTMLWTMARPSPLPPLPRPAVRKASKTRGRFSGDAASEVLNRDDEVRLAPVVLFG
jgi:hypothetical protein